MEVQLEMIYKNKIKLFFILLFYNFSWAYCTTYSNIYHIDTINAFAGVFSPANERLIIYFTFFILQIYSLNLLQKHKK